jgi:hypothetical protein
MYFERQLLAATNSSISLKDPLSMISDEGAESEFGIKAVWLVFDVGRESQLIVYR